MPLGQSPSPVHSSVQNLVSGWACQYTQMPVVHWVPAWHTSPIPCVGQSQSGNTQSVTQVPSGPQGWQSGSSKQPMGAHTPLAAQAGSLASMYGCRKSST